MLRYVFVGDRRSELAKRRNVTWADRQLAAKTLFAALEPLGLVYKTDYDVVNAYLDSPAWTVLDSYDFRALQRVQHCAKEGTIIIAMGRKAESALLAHNIPHRYMTHPAARGAIRKTARYRAHVRAVVGKEKEYGDL